MNQLPTAYLTHDLPRRCRIRVPARRRETDYFAETARSLTECEGVESVEANPMTAGFLVIHDTTSEKIGAYASDAGLFDLKRESPPPGLAITPGVRALSGITDANRWLIKVSDGRIDFWSALASLFILFAVVQAARGRLGVPAISALWYALSAVAMGEQLGQRPKTRK